MINFLKILTTTCTVGIIILWIHILIESQIEGRKLIEIITQKIPKKVIIIGINITMMVLTIYSLAYLLKYLIKG